MNATHGPRSKSSRHDPFRTALVALLLALLTSAVRGAGPTPGSTPTLAFNSTRDGNYEVYTTAAAGGPASNLTANEALDWVYHSAGGLLYLVSVREGRWKRPDYDLYEVRPDGSGWRRITQGLPVYDSYLGVAPDGGRLVVCSRPDGDREIYVIDRDGATMAKLTDNTHQDCDPDWSPDGKSIVFRSDRGGSWDLWVMQADGSEPRNLTRSPANESFPSWSPDGAHIAYGSDSAGDEEVFVMAADGTGARRLTESPKLDGSPVWITPAGTTTAQRE
jgi:TolB protein